MMALGDGEWEGANEMKRSSMCLWPVEQGRMVPCRAERSVWLKTREQESHGERGGCARAAGGGGEPGADH